MQRIPLRFKELAKEQLLRLYRNLTKWQRARNLRALEDAHNVPVSILFYHRVADEHPNGWTLSCRDFARQLDWLQSNCDVVSLSRAQEILSSGKCEQPTVALTFDDGYADNSLFAIPELARRSLPATYFVSTDFTDTSQSFPHDEAAGIPLTPNTLEQLQHYQTLGMEIGAHTRSHCNLGTIQDLDRAQSEILGSIECIEEWLGSKVHYFAFPFGFPANMSQLAADILIQSGVKGFCSAYGAFNWPQSCNPFHLKRIHADPGIERLRNWLTLDPRKLIDDTELPFVLPSFQEIQGKSSDVAVPTLPVPTSGFSNPLASL